MSSHSAHFKAIFDHLATLGWSRLAREHGYQGSTGWFREQCRVRGREPITLLDLGCGDGQIGAVLAEEGLRGPVTGIDLSDKMLETCRARGLYTELLERDLERGIRYEGDTRFNLVCACGVFEYLLDVVAVLEELRQLCVPGAELWATFQTPPAPEHQTEDQATRREARWYTRDEVSSLLEHARWRALSIEQRVAGEAVTSDDSTGLRALGWNIEYLFVRAVRGD